jgi:zinc D-Ala-D-Ala dipeptidase
MAPTRPDDAARRAYWTHQLEEAHQFMMEVMDYPVQECGERFVDLKQAARDAGVEVTFSDKPHVLGLPRLYYLRQGQIAGFVGAARDMNKRGWIMRVDDGYRTTHMQKHLGRSPQVFSAILKSVIWELGGKTPDPEFFLRRSMTLVALMPKIGTHMSGSAIDISVFDRASGKEIDRGGPYLEMSELTPMLSPFVTEEQRRNRLEITAVMNANGWIEYPYEFWHYNFGDAYGEYIRKTGKPGKYGAVDWSGPETNRVTPIANPKQPLNSHEEIKAEIDAALKRLK